MISEIELDFLRESNNIEDEYDDMSLQDAILAWQYCKKQKKLSAKIVREVHQILMRSRKNLLATEKGVFRNGSVFIGGREGKPWYVIPELIEQWLLQANQGADRYESVPEEKIHAAREAHIFYEQIHPFFDGNGRTGRIFYNWQRVKCGLPIHVIHVGKEQYEYYKWFQ